MDLSCYICVSGGFV